MIFVILLEDEREFDYGEKSKKGPKMWGKLKKEWEACNNGEMQSPIDLSHERVRIIQKPDKRHYKLCNATVKNRGHDISVSIYSFEFIENSLSIFIAKK